MKIKANSLIYSMLILGALLIFAGSCKKDDDKNNDNNAGIPMLSTTAVTDITQTTAKSGGDITSDGGAKITASGVCWSTSETPTISDNKTTNGKDAGVFSSSLSGLSPSTSYYVRAYATNSTGTGYGTALYFTTEHVNSAGSFTDSRDGNVYKTVTIGNQVWMAENLKFLPSVVGPLTGSQTLPYYYVYGYNGTSVNDAKATENYTTYGVLYNWPAAMNGATSSTANPSGVQGICPAGWHLPSDAEWTQLTAYLVGETVAGGKLKATTLWNSPNTGATNETGFTALPGGYRYLNGTFYLGSYGYWWSTREYDTSNAWSRSMRYYCSDVYRHGSPHELGISVRCVRD